MTVLASGGFDPLHIGHVHYLQEARKLGDRLIVIVNSDDWLRRKKGKAFMPEDDRAEIVRAIVPDAYVTVLHSDTDTIEDALYEFKPHIFAKGGDRTIDNIPEPERAACLDIKASIVTNVGGGKIRSSSDLLAAYGA